MALFSNIKIVEVLLLMGRSNIKIPYFRKIQIELFKNKVIFSDLGTL